MNIRPYAFHADHAACLDFWASLGVGGASVLHIDMHHDLDSLQRGYDEGNFLRAAIEQGIASCVTWVVPLRGDMMTGAMANTFLSSLPIDAARALRFSGGGVWTTEIGGARVDIVPCDGFKRLRHYDLLGLDLDVFYHREFGGPVTPPDWLLEPLQTLIESDPAKPVFICSGLEDGYVPATYAPLFNDFRQAFERMGRLRLNPSLLAFSQLLEQMRVGHVPVDPNQLRDTMCTLGGSPGHRAYLEAWIAYLEGRIEAAATMFAQGRDVFVFHPLLEALADYRAGQVPSKAAEYRSKALSDHWFRAPVRRSAE